MKTIHQHVRDQLLDENPSAILLDNMDAALVGYGRQSGFCVAVYSQKAIYEKLFADGFERADVDDYFIKLAVSGDGENTPVILADMPEE